MSKNSTDVEEFSESGGMDPSDSSGILSNDSDGNDRRAGSPTVLEICIKQTPKAMLTLRRYFM